MDKENFNRYREEEAEEGLDTNQVEENKTESNVVENLKLEELQAEVNKYRDMYLRTLAETENFKKRMNDEKIRDRKYACYSFAEKLIGPLDIFDKVISVKPEDEKLRNYLIGFEMINNQLKQAIEDEGVKRIKAFGEQFDPRIHHAVETVWDETQEENVIVEELQSGYMFKDRVLRAALVKVNKKPIENSKEEN